MKTTELCDIKNNIFIGVAWLWVVRSVSATAEEDKNKKQMYF
jgi:hypothetical protein